MATLLGQLLRGSTLTYNRPDCLAMDSSSTALPGPSASPLTADGVTLAPGSRVLYTALTTGGQPNNWVYVMTVSYASGSASYSMAPAHDGRSPNQTGYTGGQGGGAPEALDCLLIDQGSTNAGKLMYYSGTAWVDSASF